MKKSITSNPQFYPSLIFIGLLLGWISGVAWLQSISFIYGLYLGGVYLWSKRPSSWKIAKDKIKLEIITSWNGMNKFEKAITAFVMLSSLLVSPFLILLIGFSLLLSGFLFNDMFPINISHSILVLLLFCNVIFLFAFRTFKGLIASLLRINQKSGNDYLEKKSLIEINEQVLKVKKEQEALNSKIPSIVYTKNKKKL